MDSSKELLIIGFATQQDWEAWLVEHYTDPTGIWLKIAKKATGTQSISYAEALEGALCYGWIDGQKATFDEQYWLQKFTPRRPKSVWSQINRDKANALIEAGRMQPSGLRQVELAWADGRWDAAYAGQSGATVPDDLQEALDKNPLARDFFLTLNSVNRYAIIFRVQTAKKAETRAAKIRGFCISPLHAVCAMAKFLSMSLVDNASTKQPGIRQEWEMPERFTFFRYMVYA